MVHQDIRQDLGDIISIPRVVVIVAIGGVSLDAGAWRLLEEAGCCFEPLHSSLGLFCVSPTAPQPPRGITTHLSFLLLRMIRPRL